MLNLGMTLVSLGGFAVLLCSNITKFMCVSQPRIYTYIYKSSVRVYVPILMKLFVSILEDSIMV